MPSFKFYRETLAAVVCLVSLPLMAQAPSHRLDGYRAAPARDQIIYKSALLEAVGALKSGQKDKIDKTMKALLDFSAHSRAFLYYMVGDQLAADRFQRFVQMLESARMDKQAGSSAGSSGGSSLVSKPSTTAVLSAAVETGALTQSLSTGPQTTFRGDAIGIGRMLLGEEPFPFCPVGQPSCDTELVKALNGLSFSVTADTNRQKSVNVPVSGSATPASSGGSTTTPTPSSVNLAANQTRVSAWGLRYGIYNHRNPNDQNYRKAYDKALAANAAALATAAQAMLAKFEPLIGTLNASPDYTKWFKDALSTLSSLSGNISEDDFEEAFAHQLDGAVAILKKLQPKATDQALQALESLDVYFATRKQLLADVLDGRAIVTFEYTNNKPLDAPTTSNFKFILAGQPSKNVMLTLNLSASIYNSLPTGVTVSRWRDAQAAGQLDIALGQIGSVTAPTFSAAGYFQYMRDPALITIGAGDLAPGTNIQLPNTAAVLLAQKGNTAIGQIKLTFPLKTSGISVPFALTWANRTDLIKANNVTGHFGLSFDLDSLLSHAKGSTQ
jgi:hypothetical protein